MHAVLITGVTGFVGTALARKMLAEGWQVRGTIRSAKDVASPPTGVETFQIESIGPDTDWLKAFFGVNTVVHLAARVHVMNDAAAAADSLAEFRQVNVAGTEHLARMAAKAGVWRFVFLSSVGVNGNVTHGLPFTEKDEPHPRNSYAISKLEAEQVLKKIAAESGMEVVIIRSPLVYGPGVKANFLRMVEVINRGVPLPFASINNRRSLIYLENLVDAIITCINHPKADGQTYLVSDGEDVSIPELIRRIATALGKPARLIPFPHALMKFAGKVTGKSEVVERLIDSLVIDSSKIRRELEWKPPFTLEEGIRETVFWYKGEMRKVDGAK